MQPTSLVVTQIASVLIATLVRVAAAELACQDSGYCSLGKLDPFVGDVHPSAGLHQALKSRSYKQEVMVMVSNLERLDNFLQAVDSLQQLGLSNVLLLSYSQDMCMAIMPFVPDIGCAWSSHKHPEDLEGDFMVWSSRYRIVARSIRLGYNVLLMDSDVIVMDDPYKYFKHPPFQQITVLNQAESETAPNGGLLYVQNAAPDGPAAFLLAEAVSRPYRWADDGWKHASTRNISEGCLYMDQESFADVLAGMESGYMLFPRAMHCSPEAVGGEHWQGVEDTIEQQRQIDQVWRDEQLPVPDSWQVMTNGSTTALRSLQLRMPNCRHAVYHAVQVDQCGLGQTKVNMYNCIKGRDFELQPPHWHMYRGWPEELGGQWYPPERGPYSKAFLDLLRADAPELPMWLDPENSSNAAAADRVPTETFAFMPTWLGCGYFVRGRQGYWDPHITGNIAQQVIAHTHFVLRTDAGVGKRAVPMSFHRYNWNLTTSSNTTQPYFACEGFGANCTQLRVLAFSASIEKLLGKSASWHEFAFLLQGLAALAIALDRAVAWPSLPCNTSWVSRGRSLEHPPLELGGMWLPWSNLEGDLMCTPGPYLIPGCLLRGTGILPWEYNHLRSQQHIKQNTSTIHAVHDAQAEHAAEDAVEESHFALARHIVEVDAGTEAETLKPLQDKPVLLLDSLVHVGFPEDMSKQRQSYDNFWQKCIVLDTAGYTAIFNLDGNEGAEPMADLGLSHRPARLSRGRLRQHGHD